MAGLLLQNDSENDFLSVVNIFVFLVDPKRVAAILHGPDGRWIPQRIIHQSFIFPSSADTFSKLQIVQLATTACYSRRQ